MRDLTQSELNAWAKEKFPGSFTVSDTGCYVWAGSRNAKGYGQLSLAGAVRKAHRVAYEAFTGPIPPGLTIDHLCRNRPCINPAHLEVVTVQENLRRGEGIGVQNGRKQHCPRGHEYDLVDSDGFRRCRTCRSEQKRAARRRAVAA